MALEQECDHELRIAVELQTLETVKANEELVRGEEMGEELQMLETVKANEERKWGKHCIYKLPACVTDLHENAYMPRSVSLGPYHNGSPKLRPMECHKSRVLVRFLHRAGKSMEDCIGALEGIAEQLMDAYDSLGPEWRNEPQEFLKLMIRDGCFMLEIMGYFAKDAYRVSKDFKSQYGDKDPIFSYHGMNHMLPHIRRDMFMLENQLPLLLLNHLLSIEGPQKTKEEDYILKIIVEFCSPGFGVSVLKDVKECEHVLAVYRKLLIKGTPNQISHHTWWSQFSLWIAKKYDPPPPARDECSKSKGNGENIIPSATRLDESGIMIRASATTSITDIHFHVGPVGGVLEIPAILVDDTTQSDFLNLMALERFHIGLGDDVTSYIGFMDDIIDSDKDVKILQTRDIVWNAYGSDMAVAQLFNSLSKDATLDPENNLLCVRKRAKDRCLRPLNKAWGDLINTYFISPWSGFALAAATFGLGLGIVSTVFTVLDYFKEDKKN